MIKLKMTGFVPLHGKMERHVDIVSSLVVGGMYQHAKEVFKQSQFEVPVQEPNSQFMPSAEDPAEMEQYHGGALRESGRVEAWDSGVRISYTEPYAAVIHEEERYDRARLPPGSQRGTGRTIGKHNYLAGPFDDQAPLVLHRIVQYAKRKMSAKRITRPRLPDIGGKPRENS